jgi:hypothetical protein
MKYNGVTSLNNYNVKHKRYMDNNTNVSRGSRVGSANPMYGRTQSQATRDAIAKSQRERYERMKEKIHHTTMDEFLQGENFKRRVAAILREELMKVVDRRISIPL